MSFQINENVTMELPDIHKRMTEFSESQDYRDNNKLIIEVAAIHAGLTANYTNYTKEALTEALSSWVHPYPRPIILNHDEHVEPVGRVMASAMDEEADGTAFTRIQVAIMDPTAIQKVTDKRYITGSVGGSADSAKCSICDVDWAKANITEGAPCRHKRGSVYEGKLAYLTLGEIKWREYSFVNVPADSSSTVRSINDPNSLASSEDESKWSYAIKMFSMDMNKPFISHIAESDTSGNLLEGMKKKEATATYMNLKGTFLSVSAVDYAEKHDENGEFLDVANTINNEFDGKTNECILSQLDEQTPKEKNMSTKTAEATTETEEDILAVSENLSADLAADGGAENLEESETVIAEDESSEESDIETDPADVAEADDSAQESVESDEQLDTEAEGTESEQAKDTDAVSESDAEEEAEEEEKEETEATDAEAAEPVEGEEEEDKEDEVKADEAAEAPAAVENEAAAELTRLTEENGKLRKALHQMLVERVVDVKIAKGITEASRAELITEHSTRTASSLADALRDLDQLPSMSRENSGTQVMENRALAAGSEEGAEFAGASVTESFAAVERTPEDVLTDVFMGRVPNLSTNY